VTPELPSVTMRKVTACLGVALIAAALGVSACDSVDPTEQFFAISFLNDTARPITLRACSDDNCRKFVDSAKIAPGRTYADNISDRDILTRWRVEDGHGRVMGCLPLRFHGKWADVVLRASQAEVCPGRAPPHVQHGSQTSGRV
jgi:hypothetical protein